MLRFTKARFVRFAVENEFIFEGLDHPESEESDWGEIPEPAPVPIAYAEQEDNHLDQLESGGAAGGIPNAEADHMEQEEAVEPMEVEQLEGNDSGNNRPNHLKSGGVISNAVRVVEPSENVTEEGPNQKPSASSSGIEIRYCTVR